MTTAIDHLEKAAQYADTVERKCPGMYILLFAEPTGLVVQLKLNGMSISRIVPWRELRDSAVNQAICAIDSALDACAARMKRG
jgi:hypothetical protein